MSRNAWRLAQSFTTNRRAFLLSGASIAILPLAGQVTMGAIHWAPGFDQDPFQLGVASGDPTADGVVLWTRLASKPLEHGGGIPRENFGVQWEIAGDDKMANIVQKGSAVATPQLGHSVHVEVQGLKPDRWYWYRFHCGDASSPIGRTRTMPQPDIMPNELRFAFASCQHFEAGLYTAYKHMSQDDLDLVIHLGDYIYEGAGLDNRLRKHVGKELMTLDDYRTRSIPTQRCLERLKKHGSRMACWVPTPSG
ncbi:MAG: PhoD-like phosphatase N-terminal domain-containing protein, partial [Pirellula sp.]